MLDCTFGQVSIEPDCVEGSAGHVEFSTESELVEEGK
jgi:hypothetical protein